MASDHTPRPEDTETERWPESSENDVDDATWVAALEASRRQQFAELADL
ncbi:MAG: hypothetical protein AAF567_05970 [Actinomycetota bacterium]